jgi:hypothetical protein
MWNFDEVSVEKVLDMVQIDENALTLLAFHKDLRFLSFSEIWSYW